MLQKKRKSKRITNIVKHSIPIVISNTHNAANKKSSLRPGISYHCDHSSSISLHSIPLLCSMALLIMGGLFMNPSCGIHDSVSQAYALNEDSSNDTTTPSVTLAWLDNIDNNLLQKEVTAGTSHISVDFNVEANAINKYEIVLQAVNTSNLIGSSTGDAINTIENETSYNSFPQNAWGYAIAVGRQANPESLTYLPVNTRANTPAYTTTEDNVPASQDFTLAFAANLDRAMPDHYKSSVVLSVVAGAEETIFAKWPDDVINMTDLTPEICRDAKVHTTGQLLDNRDGTERKYWVTKMADGNCWMSQNLDYDDPSSTKFTSSIAGWTSQSATYRAYYNPGYNGDEYIWNGYFNQSESCTSSTSLSDCLGKGLVLGSANLKLDYENRLIDSSWSITYSEAFPSATQYVGSDGETLCTKTAGKWLGDMTSEYKQCRVYYYKFAENVKLQNSMNYDYEHYNIGNYYTWASATKASGNSLSSGDAPSSICPNGWQLPSRSGLEPNFHNLLSAYVPERTGSANPSEFGIDLNLAPFYYVVTGTVNYASTNKLRIGQSVRYWLKTAASGDIAETISYNGASSGVNTTGGTTQRYNGIPIRCLVKASE